MTPTKKLGIWMDHANAHIMAFPIDPIDTNIVKSELAQGDEEYKGEKMIHNKEQGQQSAFYKQLAEIIVNYEDVLLFGPTDAKVELFNILKADHHFAGIKIEVKQSDKLTENQQQAFVKDYFSEN